MSINTYQKLKTIYKNDYASEVLVVTQKRHQSISKKLHSISKNKENMENLQNGIYNIKHQWAEAIDAIDAKVY